MSPLRAHVARALPVLFVAVALVSPLVPLARRIKREDGVLIASEWERRALEAEKAWEAGKSELLSTKAALSTAEADLATAKSDLSTSKRHLAEAKQALAACRAQRHEPQESPLAQHHERQEQDTQESPLVQQHNLLLNMRGGIDEGSVLLTYGQQPALLQTGVQVANSAITESEHATTGSRSEVLQLQDPCLRIPQSLAEVDRCSQVVLTNSAGSNNRVNVVWFLCHAAEKNLTSATAAAAGKAALKDHDFQVRAAGAYLLGNIASAAPRLADADTAALLLDRVLSDSAGPSGSSAWGLERLFDARPDLGSLRAVQVLQRALWGPDEWAVGQISKALGALAAGRADLAPAVVRYLFQSLTWATWDPSSKRMARPQAAVLSAIFVERLDKVQEDLVATLVGAAIEFYQFKDGQSPEPRRELAQFTAHFFVIPRAHSFPNLRGRYAVWLAEALKSEFVRNAQLNLVVAIRTLGSAAGILAPQLREVLKQPPALSETKRVAVLALQQANDTSTETRNTLGDLLNSTSTEVDVKVAVCNYIWAMQEGAEPMAEVLGRALNATVNPSASVRAAAARALGAAGVAAAMVLPRLVAALQDNAWEVQLEVARILARFGQELNETVAIESAGQLTRIMTGATMTPNPPALRVAATLAIGSLGEYADSVLQDLERTLLTSGLLEERKAAEATLGRLSTGSPAAAVVWKALLATWGRASALFEAVVTSSASEAAEEWQGFARRSQDTGTFFVAAAGCAACWPAAGRGLDKMARLATDAFTVVTNRSVQDSRASCAALCARATPFVIDQAGRSPKDMASFRGLFANPDHSDWEGVLRIDARRLAGYCVAFTVLKVSNDKVSCLLFQTMPEGTTKTAAMGTPIYSIQAPKSASFCAAAWRNRNQSKKTLVATCKNTLAPQVSSSTGTTRQSNGATINAICQEECEALVERVQAIAQMPDYSPERRDFAMSEGVLNTLTTDAGKEVALADACTRDVVQLVEHHLISCCATACGWTYRTRTCEGNTALFSSDALLRWREECCTAMGIIRGSDRDRMCAWALTPQTANLVSAELTPRGDSEAAEMGQDVAVTLNASAPAARASGSFLQVSDALSEEPPLSEQGYLQVVGKGVETMKVFVARVVESMDAVISDPSQLTSFATWHSSNSTKQNFTQLTEELRGISQTEGGWVRKQDAASPCRLQCREQAFFPMTLAQCSDRSRQEWFATSAAPSFLCRGHDVENVTDSPHKCGELAHKWPLVHAARWQFLPTSFAQGGRPAGTCQLFSNCLRNLTSLWRLAKASMNGTSEALWLRIVSTAT